MENFLNLFRELLEDTAPESVNASTAFKQIEDWSSLMALSLIAMIDENYDVTLSADDIREAKTIEELFNKVESLRN